MAKFFIYVVLIAFLTISQMVLAKQKKDRERGSGMNIDAKTQKEILEIIDSKNELTEAEKIKFFGDLKTGGGRGRGGMDPEEVERMMREKRRMHQKNKKKDDL